MSQSREYLEFTNKLKTLKIQVHENEPLRRRLYSLLRETLLDIETPIDTVRRIAFSPLDLIMGKIASNLELFQLLSNGENPMDIDAIMSNLATKVEKTLLSRLLRYLAATGMIAEQKEYKYGATNTTHTLSHIGFKAGLDHHFDAQLPAWLALPSLLGSISYKNPSDPMHTAFQVAHHTTLPAFQWASMQPRVMRDFAMWMSAQREGQGSWLDVFPSASLESDSSNVEDPIFVDVGGGVGHQCLALQSRYPNLKRRIILQDLPSVLEKAKPSEGIEQMPHDFRKAQPICNASYYYLRNVLHDYPDSECINILSQIRPAMASKSKILIDEKVIPETGTSWQAVQLDIAVMASLAGQERTLEDWHRIIEAAGLHIEKALKYDEELADNVILVTLP